MNEKDLARFMRKVIVNPVSECWDWQGRKFHHGYGCFKIRATNAYAHRLAYEHMRDCAAKGRRKGRLTGSSNPAARLTDDVIRAIRSLHATGLGPTEIGRRYGLGRTHVQRIIRRKLWAHVAPVEGGTSV